MGCRTAVVWDAALLDYDLGDGHPMRSVRVELAMALADALGVLARPDVRLVAPRLASDDELARIHDPGYLAAVRAAEPDETYGLGTEDVPVWPGMHEASARVAGAALVATDAVLDGSVDHGVSLAGGLHHAHRAAAAGFCVYNDVALAVARLADSGRRVVYVDVDAHHGDGVQEAFADDPRVLTISLHQSGRTLFPGTGYPEDVGEGAAEGSIVNVALPPFTADAGWLRAFTGVLPVLVRAFEPDVLVIQCGADAHRDDPLTDLNLSVAGMRTAYRWLHELAHEVCAGRLVAFGGGGYNLDAVVPRAWAALLAEVTGEQLAPDLVLPMSWRMLVRERIGRLGPDLFCDRQVEGGGDPPYRPWDAGEGDPDDPLDRAVAATRSAVLPLYGLDPWRDR